MSLIAHRMTALGTENAFKLGADIARCEARGMDVIRLNLGEPDAESAPHINAAAIAAIQAGNSHYCDPAGLPSLRKAIAAHIQRTRHVDVDPDRVIVTTGGKPSIGYTMQTYVDPGDEVIYPSPGFPIYESWVTFVGGSPVPLHLRESDGFAMTADALRKLHHAEDEGHHPELALESDGWRAHGEGARGDRGGDSREVQRRCARVLG